MEIAAIADLVDAQARDGRQSRGEIRDVLAIGRDDIIGNMCAKLNVHPNLLIPTP